MCCAASDVHSTRLCVVYLLLLLIRRVGESTLLAAIVVATANEIVDS